MALLKCADCGEKVSASAMDCVHCGNVLQKPKPGAMGILLRALYGLFTLGVVLATYVATRWEMYADPNAVFTIPLIGFGIWIAGSIVLLLLINATKRGRTVRVDGATQQAD